MQCTQCRYISFKIEKACGVCGFKFTKNQKSTSISANESLSFFELFPAKEKKIQEEKEDSVENVSVLETLERETFINPETGDFNLDLVEVEGYKIENTQASSDSNKEISIYEPPDFGPNKYIYHEKNGETQSTDTKLSAFEKPNNSDETSFLEPQLEIGEPLTPELDLGESKIKLDLSYEPIPPNEPDLTSSSSGLANLNLEIDNSDEPFITKSNEIAEIEIEDLNLESKSSDEPEKDKS